MYLYWAVVNTASLSAFTSTLHVSRSHDTYFIRHLMVSLQKKYYCFRMVQNLLQFRLSDSEETRTHHIWVYARHPPVVLQYWNMVPCIQIAYMVGSRCWCNSAWWTLSRFFFYGSVLGSISMTPVRISNCTYQITDDLGQVLLVYHGLSKDWLVSSR